jgi:undecaprenyl-diphosphatase
MLHPRTIDKSLAALIAKLPPTVTPVMTFASFIATPPIVALILVIALASSFFTGNDQLFKTAAIILVLSPLAELSKLITRRRRPETLYVQNMRFKTYSFPSGHSYISALVFGFLATLAFAWGPFGWLLSLLLMVLVTVVGISRIYLGAHFPSDVLVGWLLGETMVYLVSIWG